MFYYLYMFDHNGRRYMLDNGSGYEKIDITIAGINLHSLFYENSF